MSEQPQNNYQEIISTASQKIVDLIKELDSAKQIDHDNYGEPIICKLEAASKKHKRIVFLRDCTLVNIVINTRKKTEDGKLHVVSRSWDENDGWKRPDTKPVRLAPPPEPGGERKKRQIPVQEKYVEAMEGIIDAD